MGGFLVPEGGGAPEGNGGAEGFPFREFLEEFVPFGQIVGCDVVLLAGVGGGLEELGGSVRGADEFELAVEDGGLALQSPEEESSGGGATGEGRDEVASVVIAIFFAGTFAVPGVFVGGVFFEWEGFASGSGGKGGDEVEGGDDALMAFSLREFGGPGEDEGDADAAFEGGAFAA